MFDCFGENLQEHHIKLPEHVLAYRTLKCANLSQENERQVNATVDELNLKAVRMT